WGAPSLDASFRRRARDGAESNQWSEFCSMLDSVTLSSSPDRIFFDLNGEGEFRVKDIHSSIDDTFLPSSDSATRWVKTVRIKVNILAWRTRLDHLSTRVNLITRGVNIDSSLCSICSSVKEDYNHLFFLCDLGKSISQRICRWWNIQWVEVSTYAEWNRVVFDSSPPRRAVIFDDINIVAENQKEEKRIIKEEEDNMIAANKKKIGRFVVVKEEEDGFETRRWSSISKARPNYADDPFKHIVFDRKINPNKKPKKNPSSSTSSSAKKDTPKTSTDDGLLGKLVYVESVMCHQYQRNDKGGVVRCTKCKTKRYCYPCMDTWYSKMTHEMFSECCPICQDNCNRKGCLRDVLPKVKEKVNFEPSADQKIQYSIYILHVLLPFLKRLNEEHIKEK
nr:JmjC domain-containing protein [Tanacetum cinerariifolium]